MSAPASSARVHVLRSAVIRESERRTLRVVAAEIGMSHSGLFNFIEGGEPRAATLKRLQAWYVQHGIGPGIMDDNAAWAALAVLLDEVPEEEREDARRGVLDTIRAAYKKSGVPPPSWLKD